MSEEKNKISVLTEKDFEVLDKLYQFYYLTNNHIQDIYGLSSRSVRSRLKLLEDSGYIVKFTLGSKKQKTYQQIYALDKGGLFSVTDYFSREKFNEESSMRLKKTYQHSLVLADILFNYEKHIKENPEVTYEILSEKKAYHFYGEEKEYKKVLRPDGAIIVNNQCMFIEYENEQKLRSLYRKMERYVYYAEMNLINDHENIEVLNENISLVFVYNTERKKENAKEKFTKIFNKLERSSKLAITCTTLEKFMNTPLDKNIYERI